MRKWSLLAAAAILQIILANDLLAQTVDLQKLARDYLALSKKNREQARELARSAGWPIRGVTPDGKVFELQGLQDGFPFYYTTSNLAAAKTTRTDSAQVYIGGGNGFTIGLWDGGAPRFTHQELFPRVTWGDQAPAVSDDHSTHVAGTMIAGGARPQAKGMAPEAKIKAYEWNDDLSEMANEASQGLLLSSHSYGAIRGWYWYGDWYWFGDTAVSEVEDYKFGFYDDESRKLDALLWAAPNYLVVTSAGNERNDSVAAGTPHLYWDSRTGGWRWSTKVRDNDGAPFGYDCIPNGFTIAKNSLTIGAVKPCPNYTGPADVQMTPFSSWGPADDGRIKPDLVGDGWEVYSCIAASDTSYEYYYGTSMASPNVCGSLALLQKFYRDRHVGASMRGATLKALAIHTAREAGGAPGPDYAFGWGLLDTYAAYRQILLDVDRRKGLIEELTLNDGAPIELSYEVGGPVPELRVTICWTDPAGTPPAPALDPPAPMLVNDLDLRVSKGDTTFEPWVLDPASPMSSAARGDNARDNVEQVVVEAPEPGLYVIRIDHKGSLRGGLQNFALVVSGAERTKTWNVYWDGSGDAPTIAAAVDSAGSGDYILVYPGQYGEHDIHVDKSVVIKGVLGPKYTYVNAQNLGRCFIIEAGSGNPRLEDLTLTNGAADGPGDPGRGGAALCSGGAIIANCLITRSRARIGGGMFIDGVSMTIKNCRIQGNAAEEGGGGVYVLSSAASLECCVVAQNSSAADGGGIYCDGASPVLANCTVAENWARGHGGGIYVGDGSAPQLEACIVAFSSMREGIYGSSGAVGAGLSCCDFFGNGWGDFGGSIPNQIGQGGNISENPQFCDFSKFDYGIGDGSACLPGGNSCGVLIGAREASCHSKTLWYVEPDGSGDAPTIQAAIDRASDGDTIVAAAGTYTGEGNRDVSYGGKALVVKSEAGPEATIIDGESSTESFHAGFYFENGEDSTSVLDGFTVKRAALGGILCTGASPVIRNCIVTGNVAIGGSRGGGVYLDGSSAHVSDCTISQNRIDPSGGGIFSKGGWPRVERCTISGNVAAKYGGGMAVQSGSFADIVRCTFSGDTAATESGGGIYIVGATAHVDSCVISGSDAKFGGGLYNGANGYCTIRNSTICGNSARQGGGGAYSSSNMNMQSCTVARNSAVYYGGGIETSSGGQNVISRSVVAFSANGGGIYTISGTQNISCSDVYGNAGGNYLGSTPDQTGKNNNISSDPQFCNSNVGDYHIYDTSPCAPASSPCAALIGALDVSCRIAPNLVIARVAIGALIPAAHDSIVATVTVTNTGVVDADSFVIDFYRNRASAPGTGQAGDEHLGVSGLAVGDSVTWITSPVTSDTIGVWNGYFAVDADDRIVETREDDNVSGPYEITWRIPVQAAWPVPIGRGHWSSPLLVDLDDEPATFEIVVSCLDGNLYAWNSQGDALPGWPVNVASSIHSSPAAGDIAGDSRKEVVVCGDDDKVHAFDVSGSELWTAYALGCSGMTPVLADIDEDSKLEVLVAAGSGVYLFEGNGAPHFPDMLYLPDGANARAPAAGDVDSDGRIEIATVAQSDTNSNQVHVYLHRRDGMSCPGYWPVTVDNSVPSDPVIGDIAASHDALEIVMVGRDGDAHAWFADGTPCFDSTSGRVPGRVYVPPVLANIDRDGYHDIIVASEKYGSSSEDWWRGEADVTVINGEGTVLSSKKIADWEGETPATASSIVIGDPSAPITAAPDSAIHADAFGFPLELGDAVPMSLAAGDIDGDGWVELIAAGGDSVHCFELCSSAYPTDALWWPLFRRNAERTACYGYEPVSGGEDGGKRRVPAATALRAIYPNPFNPVTRIQFDVSARGRVELAIFDVAGRRMCVLVDKEMEAGSFEAIWTGRSSSGLAASSGVYFCRLKAGTVLETKKMVLIR